MEDIFEQMNNEIDKFYGHCDRFIKEHIPEDDYTLTWKEFHKLHPSIDQWEYEQGVKKFQEM